MAETKASNDGIASFDELRVLLVGEETSEAQNFLEERRRNKNTRLHCCRETRQVKQYANQAHAIVMIPLPGSTLQSSEMFVRKILHSIPSKINNGSIFLIVYHTNLVADPLSRLRLFEAGVSMLAHDLQAVHDGIQCVQKQFQTHNESSSSSPLSFSCPICGLDGLSECGLRLHIPLYHSMRSHEPNDVCPVCAAELPSEKNRKNNLAVHLHNFHGPMEAREPRESPFAAFVWVLCRNFHPNEDQFLLVNEPAAICPGGQIPKYWFPAGRVDPGETLTEAALRETMEEAGVAIEVRGVVQFRRSRRDGTPRIVLYAEPNPPQSTTSTPTTKGIVPKSIPDFESCGALWLDHNRLLDHLSVEHTRSSDPLELIPALAHKRLRIYSIDTPAFQEMEYMIRDMTGMDNVRQVYSKNNRQRIENVWIELWKQYPPDCFAMDW